jgi:hypothetical protein
MFSAGRPTPTTHTQQKRDGSTRRKTRHGFVLSTKTSTNGRSLPPDFLHFLFSFDFLLFKSLFILLLRPSGNVVVVSRMSCNGSSTLYCEPTLDAVLFENQTYTLDYNAQFHSIAGDSNVDIYLYAANGSTPAQVFSDMPNDGEMTFTINDVSTSFLFLGD